MITSEDLFEVIVVDHYRAFLNNHGFEEKEEMESLVRQLRDKKLLLNACLFDICGGGGGNGSATSSIGG